MHDSTSHQEGSMRERSHFVPCKQAALHQVMGRGFAFGQLKSVADMFRGRDRKGGLSGLYAAKI